MEKNVTIGEKYGPAMEIKTQKEADRYFEECVQHHMSFGVARKEAERMERVNLGYFAGYYDTKTRIRVEKLFKCIHPIFGSAEQGTPTTEEALQTGIKMGKEWKDSKEGGNEQKEKTEDKKQGEGHSL